MSEQTIRAWKALAVFGAMLLPVCAMLIVLVWPPKRPLTILCMRIVGALVFAAWPSSMLYAATLNRDDPKFVASMTLMMADAAPLVFVSMRTAMLFPRTVAWLNRHAYVVVGMVLAISYGFRALLAHVAAAYGRPF